MNNTLQLTIRGLDTKTKEALVKKANQQGLSLNRYALKALRNSAGIDSGENRYVVLKEFLNNHSINKADKNTFDEAITWSDRVSIDKQQKEESDTRI